MAAGPHRPAAVEWPVMETRSICVFAGSSPGNDPAFADAARTLATELVSRGYGLVYGGAKVGLMGILADTALAAGGHVFGVMPDFLGTKEIVHTGLPELKITSSMQERKNAMATRAHGFIAMPGGFGTIEEFFEALTWAQLGLHAKPCGLLNVNGYYDSLLAFLDHAVSCQLLRKENRDMVIAASDPRDLLDRMQAYTAPRTTKWITTERT
jgi:uncharacterized protein (TIGR00730 family)